MLIKPRKIKDKDYINISSLLKSDFNSLSSNNTIKKIERACVEVGFFQIIGHEIEIRKINNICKIGSKFFNSSEENKKKLETPIILLTAKGEANDRIEGLEIGADDYLPKPFEPKELILRIQNIIEKTKKNYQKRIVNFENIKIDLNRQLILKSDIEYKINNTEKTILEKMINNPGKTFSREDIGALIDLDKERSIDVIITRLRKKIEIDPKNPKFLQTIRGAGYVLWIE